MSRYVVKRVLHTLLVLLGVSLMTFALIHMTPGDPVLVMLGTDATPSELDRLRHLLGLDQPLYVQYAQYLGRLLTGQMGDSIFQHQAVSKLIGDRFPATVELTLAAMSIAVVLGMLTGVISAVVPYSLFDVTAMLIALAGVAMPVFWLGMLAILLFSLQLGWLPSFGRGEPFVQAVQYWFRTGDPSDVVDSLRHIVLPALTLGAFSAALISRLVRSALLEVLGQDYVRTARAKGLAQAPVIAQHALPNALIPVITVIGLQVGTLLGGAVLAETIFAWPGMGRLLIQAISQRDYPLVQGIVMVTALAVSIINVIVDLLYATINPRVRYG
ncbi:MAG: ABC transporter permease [Chloroflexi bacterium]|nr:MAG: ABC transporter permease [Chloroflexota bacterium]